jgi:hypothetical protein
MTHQEQGVSVHRRGWLKSLLRHGALGAIAVLVVYLLGRRPGEDCWRLTTSCRSCDLLPRCNLPPAQSSRQGSGQRANKERT